MDRTKKYCIDCVNYVPNRQSKPRLIDFDCCIIRNVWIEETPIKPKHLEEKEEMDRCEIKNRNNNCRDFTPLHPIMKGMQANGNREMDSMEERASLPAFRDIFTEMVLIPAGEFIMGTSDAQVEELLRQFPEWKRKWFATEQPQHRIYLDSYYIDRYPVTSAQYEQFTEATGYQAGGNWRGYYTAGKEKHPVVNVSWYDALAYAQWAGKRLPTEAEWEKAARGIDGRLWPWGNMWDKKKCNSREGGAGTATPVGNYPDGASPYGVMDMVGNVWEWCADWYGENYYRDSPYRDPRGPNAGAWRVQRGGSLSYSIIGLRSAYRGNGPVTFAFYPLGFRCARDA